jgi:hypothetical protein
LTGLFWSMDESCAERQMPAEMEEKMNFYDKKTRKIISTVIIVVIILAMVIPILSYAL